MDQNEGGSREVMSGPPGHRDRCTLCEDYRGALSQEDVHTVTALTEVHMLFVITVR